MGKVCGLWNRMSGVGGEGEKTGRSQENGLVYIVIIKFSCALKGGGFDGGVERGKAL